MTNLEKKRRRLFESHADAKQRSLLSRTMSNATASASSPLSNGTIAAAAAAAAAAGTSPETPQVDMIGVLGTLLKSQTGEQVTNERMAHILLSNMHSLIKQGKLNQNQILQVRLQAVLDESYPHILANSS